MNDNELANLLGMGKGDDSPTLAWGKVTAVDSESVVANVMGASVAAVRCCDCSVGDVVALEGQKGRWRAIGRKGGEDWSIDKTISSYQPNLHLKNINADSASTDTANRFAGLYANDKNNQIFAWLEGSRRTDGSSRVTLGARSLTSGSQVDNSLRLSVSPDGSRAVTISEAYPWQSALMGVGRELPSGYDFNGATYPGVYYTGSSAVSASCPNCPIADQGVMLKVERSIGSNVVTQTVRGWADGKTYTRGINGSTIYPWQMNGGYSAIFSSHLDATWGEWCWIKWSDGNAMCWKYIYTSWAVTTAWGGLYMSGVCPQQRYPFDFTWSPGFTVMPVNWNAGYSMFPVYNYNGSATYTPTWFYARAGSSVSTVGFNTVIFAWGRWK